MNDFLIKMILLTNQSDSIDEEFCCTSLKRIIRIHAEFTNYVKKEKNQQ